VPIRSRIDMNIIPVIGHANCGEHSCAISLSRMAFAHPTCHPTPPATDSHLLGNFYPSPAIPTIDGNAQSPFGRYNSPGL
jgi:hypothetical protein